MDLPKNERTFDFNAVGDNFGKAYNGTFTVRCVLNIFERRLLELEKSKLRSDIVNPTPDLIALTTILANLRLRVKEAPEWWKQSNGGDNMEEENVLVELFDKVMEQETLWRKNLKSEKEENNMGNAPKGS